MYEYQFYRNATEKWIDIYNCPIKEFRRSYPHKKIRLNPIYPIADIAGQIPMINKFLVTI